MPVDLDKSGRTHENLDRLFNHQQALQKKHNQMLHVRMITNVKGAQSSS